MTNNSKTTPFEHGLGRVLVVGLGVTGFSVLRYLSTRGGVAGIADDRAEVGVLKKVMELAPKAVAYLGGESKVDCRDFDTVVLSPGVPRRSELILKALELGLEVMGDIELFAREVSQPVISVTGSNGKSTVVHLLTQMAQTAGIKVALGGNFGVPALDVLSDEIELYVLELSSFQLESCESLSSKAATVLNISPDHMDRYESISEYAHYKARIYANAKIQIINRDDELARDLAIEGETRSFGLGAAMRDQDFGIRKLHGARHLVKGERILMPVAELKMLGTHNQANALAALALGEVAGLDEASMLDTLRSYTGLDHRTQWVAKQEGVIWVNDSKATNTGATIAALEGMPGPVVLIAGGQGKGATFNDLAGVVAEYCRHVITIGEDADAIASVLKSRVALSSAGSMQEAVSLAAELAVSGDVVLLSPACASFDMFAGYAQRGEAFISQVEILLGGSR